MAQRTFGKYKLTRLVGVGGMAEVYEASLEGAAGFTKRVAVKLPLEEFRNDPEFVGMFIDEATILSKLKHPNIVEVYDFGELDGHHFMVMEFVEGWDLSQLARRYRHKQRAFPIHAAAFVVRELCRGLDYIHKAGVVHRDVTPQNVFITSEGWVKLGDFGIAKAEARITRTVHGEIKGKLAYMAPEQVSGEPVTQRTDIYAAGLILFELLAGRRLIQGSGGGELIDAVTDPPVIAPSSLRPEAAGLDAIVARALEKTPTLRYPNAALFAADLDRFLEPQPVRKSGLVKLATGSEQWISASEAAPLDLPAAGAVRTRAVEPAQARAAELTRTETAAPREEQPASPSERPARWSLAVAMMAAAVVIVALSWPTSRQTGANDVAGSMPDQRTKVAPAPSPDLNAAKNSDGAASPADLAKADSGYIVSKPIVMQPHRRVARRPRQRRDSAPSQPPDATVRLPTISREKLQQRLAALQATARSRGLWPGDDPGLDRALATVRQQMRAGRLDEASQQLGKLRGRVDGFRIDRAFAERKMRRLNQQIASARLSAGKRDSLVGDTQRIVRLIMAGHLVNASALMSQTAKRLGR